MSANGLHRIRWRRIAVARIHRTAASQFARDLVNIQQSIVEETIDTIIHVLYYSNFDFNQNFRSLHIRPFY